MKRLAAAALLALSLGACQRIQAVEGAYTALTTATVDANHVVIAANAFDALKATAGNYAAYCIQNAFPRPVCSASNRRIVIKAIRSGTAARVQLEASIQTGSPAVASVYNALIAAVQALQASPIGTVKGS